MQNTEKKPKSVFGKIINPGSLILYASSFSNIPFGLIIKINIENATNNHIIKIYVKIRDKFELKQTYLISQDKVFIGS